MPDFGVSPGPGGDGTAVPAHNYASSPARDRTRIKRRRAVCYEDVDRLPSLPTSAWFRLVALAWWRGTLSDRYAYRMARHLTHHATAAGLITDLPKVMGLYMSMHRVGRRTFWKDLDRLRSLGLVRKVRGAAPGLGAEYTLCNDLARLPDDLPKSLGRAVTKVVDDPARLATKRPTLASIHRTLADCVTVQYGSHRCSTPIRSRGCGLVHTSPYSYEGPTPPPHASARDRVQDEHGLSPWGAKNLDEEREAAREVLRACVPVWMMQRAGRVPEGTEVPGAATMASLEHMVRLLLRYLPASEAVELLSAQVGSARDVAGLVRWRIGRTLRSVRRRHQVAVDDAGVRHAQWVAGQAARWEAVAQSPVRRAAIDAARQVQVRRGLDPDTARWSRADGAAAAVRWATESEHEVHAVVQELADLETGQAQEREAARVRAIIRARQERAAAAWRESEAFTRSVHTAPPW